MRSEEAPQKAKLKAETRSAKIRMPGSKKRLRKNNFLGALEIASAVVQRSSM